MFVGPEHWYLFQVNYLAPRTLRWLLDLWKIGVIFKLTPFLKTLPILLEVVVYTRLSATRLRNEMWVMGDN
jgi:hypothetical protein